MGKALRKGLTTNLSPIDQLSSVPQSPAMHLLLVAMGCRYEWGSKTVMCLVKANEQEGWRLGESTSFYPRHERGGRTFWFLAKEWRIFQISQEGRRAGRGVGALMT